MEAGRRAPVDNDLRHLGHETGADALPLHSRGDVEVLQYGAQHRVLVEDRVGEPNGGAAGLGDDREPVLV